MLKFIAWLLNIFWKVNIFVTKCFFENGYMVYNGIHKLH